MRRVAIGLAVLGLSAGGAAAQKPPPPGAPTAAEAEAAALGRRLAHAGDFQAVASAFGEAQVADLVASRSDLTESERARLETAARRRLEEVRERLLVMVGRLYARRIALEDLRAIVAFYESPAGRRYTGALPTLVPEIAKMVEATDLRAELLRAYCAEPGAVCPQQ